MENLRLSDEEAVRLVQLGEAEMFALLVERYEEKLLRYGRRFISGQEDIEDIVQEVFMSAYQNIQSFDTRKLFSSWIYRIAHNAYVNRLKRSMRDRLRLIDLDTLVSHPAYDDPAEDEREKEMVRQALSTALDKLELKYKEVLVLYYLEEMTYKEIADILSVPISTVGIRLMRGREALKNIYTKLYPQNGKD